MSFQVVSRAGVCRICIVQLMVLLVTPVMGGQQPGTQKWFVDTGGNVQSSPAIGPEGVIYVGSQDKFLYAINPDGTVKWKYEAEQVIFEPPSIDEDGTIYAVDNNGTLIALDPDGMLKWTFVPVTATRPGTIAIAEDGTVYYSVGSTYYAVNPNGTQFWSLDDSSVGSANGMSIGMDGVILISHGNGPLTAHNPLTGAQIWRFDTDFGGSDAAPSVAEDGTIYYGIRFAGNNFYAVNPDGSLKWKVALDAQIDSAASTAANGDIYVPINFKVTQGMNKGLVLCLNPEDGSEKWRYETDGGVGTVPAVGLDGNIYFATTANKLVALQPDGAELWVFAPATGGGSLNFNSSPTIDVDGTVFFGSTDTNFYAVRSSSAGLGAGSWPKAHGDIRNTSRFGSDLTRRRWYASHVYWLDEENNTVVSVSHIGGEGSTTASFRIDVLNRDGSAFFSIDGSVEPGATKEFVLIAPGNQVYAGAALIDASVKDGISLAPYLTWNLDVSEALQPLRIGANWEETTAAAQNHNFVAEASATNGLGIGVMNIGKNTIDCLLGACRTFDISPLFSTTEIF